MPAFCGPQVSPPSLCLSLCWSRGISLMRRRWRGQWSKPWLTTAGWMCWSTAPASWPWAASRRPTWLSTTRSWTSTSGGTWPDRRAQSYPRLPNTRLKRRISRNSRHLNLEVSAQLLQNPNWLTKKYLNHCYEAIFYCKKLSTVRFKTDCGFRTGIAAKVACL